MEQHHVTLKDVTREDVSRIRLWLDDDEVAESWFGRYSYGDPAHLGYHPNEVEDVSDEEWRRIFDNPEHRILPSTARTTSTSARFTWRSRNRWAMVRYQS